LSLIARLARVFVPIGPLIIAAKLEAKKEFHMVVNFPYEFYKTAPKKLVHYADIYYRT
jgi:hypothetical protein